MLGIKRSPLKRLRTLLSIPLGFLQFNYFTMMNHCDDEKNKNEISTFCN